MEKSWNFYYLWRLIVVSGYNERKLQILEYVYMQGSVTSSNLAEALDMEIHNVRTLLRKYSLQGLLTHHKIDARGTRAYEITGKGLERINWIKNELSNG